MEYVLVALRWVHVLSVVTLVGGLIFQCCVLLPGLKVLSDEQRTALREAMRGTWAKCVMVTAGLILLSGIVNIGITFPRTDFGGPKGLYHGLVGLKLLLAFVILYIASLLSGRSAAAHRFREKEGMWLNVVVFLGIIAICVGGVMRFIPREPKVRAEEPAPAAQSAPLLANCLSLAGRSV